MGFVEFNILDNCEYSNFKSPSSLIGGGDIVVGNPKCFFVLGCVAWLVSRSDELSI